MNKAQKINKDYFEPWIMQSYFLEAVNRNAEHMNVWERVTVHVFAGSTAVFLSLFLLWDLKQYSFAWLVQSITVCFLFSLEKQNSFLPIMGGLFDFAVLSGIE